jgi:hypothetical protein
MDYNLNKYEKNTADYITKLRLFYNKSNFYSNLEHKFEKKIFNIELFDTETTSVKTNYIKFNNYLVYDKYDIFFETGYDFKDYTISKSFEERMDDLHSLFNWYINDKNTVSWDNMYNIEKGSFSLTSLEHIYDNKNFSISNSINYSKDNINDNYYYLNTNINYSIMRKESDNWKFGYSQVIDIEKKYLKEQKIYITKTLHCMLGELGYEKTDPEQYTVYFMFKIKAYPEQGLGFEIEHNDESGLDYKIKS